MAESMDFTTPAIDPVTYQINIKNLDELQFVITIIMIIMIVSHSASLLYAGIYNIDQCFSKR